MKRRYHLHLPALLYCMLVLLVGSAAMNSQNNLLFWIFGLMFSGLIVSGVVSGVMMLGIRIRRIDPDHVAVGEPLIVRYQITNRNRLVPIFNIHVEELPVRGQRSDVGGQKSEVGRQRSDDGHDALTSDRSLPAAAGPLTSGNGWQQFMSNASAWVMHVGPRETVHGEAVFWPKRRGEVNFNAIRVWTTFPFGLVKKSITIEQPQHTRIFPQLHQVRRGLLRSIDTPGPVGTRITQRAGGTDDYFGLREYRENESIRHIAWKRSAMMGGEQLVCIERSMPSPPRLRLVLDLSTPTNELRIETNDKWSARELEERMISLAASIIHQANFLGFEVGLTVVGLGPRSGIGSQRSEVRGQRSKIGGPKSDETIVADAPTSDLCPLTSDLTSELHFAVRRNFWHARKLLAALASIDLDQARCEPDFAILTEHERSGLLILRPDRVKPISDRPDIAYFTARQLERLTTGPIGWIPTPALPNDRASEAASQRSDSGIHALWRRLTDLRPPTSDLPARGGGT